jgi:hypothetical protein
MSLRNSYITPRSQPTNGVLDHTFSGTEAELITLTEVKTHLFETSTDNDTELTALLTQCRKAIESFTSLTLCSGRTLTVLLKNENGNIEIPYGPHGVITSIHDIEGTEIVAADYTVRGLAFKWVEAPCSSYLKIVIAVGYTVIPAELKLAILNEIAYRFAHKGDENLGVQICEASRSLAEPFRRYAWR